MFLLLLFLACPKPPTPVPVATPIVPVAAPTAAPSFAPLEEQVARMLSSVEQGDQLDRLVILQELILKTRGMDAASQKALYVYAEQALAIEQRNLPMPIADAMPEANIAPVDVETLSPIRSSAAERLQEARKQAAAKKYLEAYGLLEGISEEEAVKLRAEVTEQYLAGEQERATTLVVEATRLEGSARREPLQKAKQILEAALAHFPDAPGSVALKGLLEQVQTDLAALPG